MRLIKYKKARLIAVLLLLFSMGLSALAIGYDSDSDHLSVTESYYSTDDIIDTNGDTDSDSEYTMDYVDSIFPIAGTYEDFENGTIDDEREYIFNMINNTPDNSDSVIDSQSEKTIAQPMMLSSSIDSTSYFPYDESPVTSGFQASYRYLGNSADDSERDGWFDELQGIASDDEYWYFSKNEHDNDNSRLFKTPHSEHLNTNFEISYRWGPEKIPNCNHFGDIDYYNYKGTGFIIVGVDECDDGHARFAFFRASDLKLMATVTDVWDYQDGGAPWISVRNEKIFSSKGG
ncbi:MAG: hypothetical protein JXQ23_08650, partial [Clostridia bacterium]|nr:hypothetical protein [Clostridia bacterium]